MKTEKNSSKYKIIEFYKNKIIKLIIEKEYSKFKININGIYLKQIQIIFGINY